MVPKILGSFVVVAMLAAFLGGGYLTIAKGFPTAVDLFKSERIYASTPESNPNGECFGKIGRGEYAFVPSNCRASGDFKISATRDGKYEPQYVKNSDGTIGNVISVDNAKGVWVYAQWGGNVTSKSVYTVMLEMKHASGCLGKCRDVRVHTY